MATSLRLLQSAVIALFGDIRQAELMLGEFLAELLRGSRTF